MEPTSPAEPVAYAWPLSVAPGEPVALYTAGPPVHARVVVARIGAHREVVWSGSVDVEPHPIPERAAADGCGWPIALEIPTAPDWRSGYYEIALISDAGRVAHEAVAFFVVRSATPDPDRPLLALCTNTYNAYNDVGGRNLYEGGTQVSFLRPLAKGREPCFAQRRLILAQRQAHTANAVVLHRPLHARPPAAADVEQPQPRLQVDLA